MELRRYAVALIPKVVPVGTKNIYNNINNKPVWFPEDLEWKHESI